MEENSLSTNSMYKIMVKEWNCIHHIKNYSEETVHLILTTNMTAMLEDNVVVKHHDFCSQCLDLTPKAQSIKESVMLAA